MEEVDVPFQITLAMATVMMEITIKNATMMVVTAVALVLSSNIVQIVNALGKTTLAMVSQVHQLEMEFAMMTIMLQPVTMMEMTAVGFSIQYIILYVVQHHF